MSELKNLNSFSSKKINKVNDSTKPDIITFYHGTPTKGVGESVDLTIVCKSPLEFGAGFYLTEDLEISKKYATYGNFNIIIELISGDKKNIDLRKLYGFEPKAMGYVNKFEVNLVELLKEPNKCIVNSKESLREKLITVLNAYKSLHGTGEYRPYFCYTYGLLCGSLWDNSAEIAVKSSVQFDKFFSIFDKSKYKDTQLCIHHDIILGDDFRNIIIFKGEIPYGGY